jgi:hypothetical protein
MATRQGRMYLEESLKIPKEYSETVHRRTVNAIIKRKEQRHADSQIRKN